MPRHPDRRLRLTRIDRGRYGDLPPEGVQLQSSAGAFEDECDCGLPNCSWERKRVRVTRGHRERVGSWTTRDGRFVLTWERAKGTTSKSHPNGYLRLWDAVWLCESWHVSMREAREEMAKRYDRATNKGDGR